MPHQLGCMLIAARLQPGVAFRTTAGSLCYWSSMFRETCNYWRQPVALRTNWPMISRGLYLKHRSKLFEALVDLFDNLGHVDFNLAAQSLQAIHKFLSLSSIPHLCSLGVTKPARCTQHLCVEWLLSSNSSSAGCRSIKIENSSGNRQLRHRAAAASA